MNTKELRGLYEAYNQVYEPEYISEEVEIATEYFYEMGLTEEGIEILIEELGLDEFIDWVYDIAEEYSLNEGAKRGGKVGTKAEIRRNQAAQAARTQQFSSPTTQGRGAKKAYRQASSAARSAARQQAASTARSAQSTSSSTPSRTRTGIAGVIGGALKAAGERARQDTELLKKSLSTASDTWKKASDTKVAQRARIGFKKGARAVEKHGHAAGSAAGRALGTAAASTFRAGMRAGQSEVGKKIKKGIAAAVTKEELDVYEYNQLLKFLYFEGYADSYKEAEYLLEELNDEQFEELCEAMTTANRKTWNAWMKKGIKNPLTRHLDSPTTTENKPTSTSSPQPQSSSAPRRKGVQNVEYKESYEAILSYLLDEGYADNIESAENIMVNMSEEWINSVVEDILNEAKQEQRFSDKIKRRIRRERLPYDGGKGKRAEGIRQDWHKRSRNVRGNEGPLAASKRYEDEPGRRIRGKGYVRYNTGDTVSGSGRGAESPTDR